MSSNESTKDKSKDTKNTKVDRLTIGRLAFMLEDLLAMRPELSEAEAVVTYEESLAAFIQDLGLEVVSSEGKHYLVIHAEEKSK